MFFAYPRLNIRVKCMETCSVLYGRCVGNQVTRMKKYQDSAMAEKFSGYPKRVRDKLLYLRRLIFETAAHIDGIGAVEETLKWDQPSYIVKGGSTIRIDWNSKTPSQYVIYFHCTTKLVDTFKELYRDTFTYEGNRAIIFNLQDNVPEAELAHCISLALTYHQRKKLPMLGV